MPTYLGQLLLLFFIYLSLLWCHCGTPIPMNVIFDTWRFLSQSRAFETFFSRKNGLNSTPAVHKLHLLFHLVHCAIELERENGEPWTIGNFEKRKSVNDSNNKTKKNSLELEPWSSGYGKRLKFQRLWVRIPAPYTGWTFFTIFVVKIVMMFVWKDRK